MDQQQRDYQAKQPEKGLTAIGNWSGAPDQLARDKRGSCRGDSHRNSQDIEDHGEQAVGLVAVPKEGADIGRDHSPQRMDMNGWQ